MEPNASTPPSGCTLQDYADRKRLPVEFLKSLGLSDWKYLGAPAVRIPYLGPDGERLTTQFRVTLDGPDKLKFKRGCKANLYGLDRLHDARRAGFVVLAEGPSDVQTLWHHDIPAIGLPSAGTWHEEWAHHFEGIAVIFVVIEPDRGGETVLNWLARSTIRERARLVRLSTAKDPSALHVADPEGFSSEWQAACEQAVPWTKEDADRRRAEAERARADCDSLSREPNLLSILKPVLGRLGLVGELTIAMLVFLSIVSRVLERPVSIVVKGPSSGGKSYVIDRVLKLIPKEAVLVRSALSERALAYSDESFVHRMLVLFEASGISGDTGAYLLRSLLSEGRLHYETVVSTNKGPRAVLLDKEGPTGLIASTTKVMLDRELETRLFSVTVNDTPAHTHAVLTGLAREATDHPSAKELAEWHALQRWLAVAEHRVTVPFAGPLASMITASATRLRRDFTTILNLIKSHAVLHQLSRQRDPEGRIVATLQDYAAIRELVNPVLGEALATTVAPTVRETVEAVRSLFKDDQSVSVRHLARHLSLDHSTAFRRVKVAIEQGFLVNRGDRGHPLQLVPGMAMPDDQEVLPSDWALQSAMARPEDLIPLN